MPAGQSWVCACQKPALAILDQLTLETCQLKPAFSCLLMAMPDVAIWPRCRHAAIHVPKQLVMDCQKLVEMAISLLHLSRSGISGLVANINSATHAPICA